MKKATFLGRVIKNELRNNNVNLTIQVRDNFKSKCDDGIERYQSDYFNVFVTENLVNYVSSNINKNDMVYIECNIKNKKYVDKKQIERYTTNYYLVFINKIYHPKPNEHVDLTSINNISLDEVIENTYRGNNG